MTFADSLNKIKDLLGTTELRQLTSKELETLYAAAYGMYQIGDYEKAGSIFTKLILHDPYETRFWKGLASCRQMQQEFQSALHAWSIVCLLSDHPPMAHFHAAECYLSLGELEEATKALNCTELHLKSDSSLTEKIKLLKAQIKNG